MTDAQLKLLINTAEHVGWCVKNASQGQVGKDGKPLNAQWLSDWDAQIQVVRDEATASAPTRAIRIRDED